LITFGRAHAEAMRGNPYFAEPLPSTSVFDQWLANFEGLVAQLENLRLELQSLTARKNRLRAGFIAIFNQRSRYVEVASNGNSELIASAGLSVRRARTRRGDLPWPGNLRILLTKANGEFEVRWTPQRAARAFFLQIAEVIEGQPRVWEQAYTGSKANALLKNLTSGTIYEVRAATIGGPSGQSPWNPPVQRMAP
jgi:hypothetical protein